MPLNNPPPAGGSGLKLDGTDVGATAQAQVFTSGITSNANIALNTNGTSILLSTFKGANSDGFNVFMGGGGQSALGEVGTTSKGSRNTALGYQALMANTKGFYNTAVGAFAGYSLTTGAALTAIGYYAGYSLTTGVDNTAVGEFAMQLNQTGYGNVAVGTLALQNNTASVNTAIGYSALNANTSGTSNVAVGNSSLAANTDGQGNTACGSGALLANVHGVWNTAVGQSALAGNTGHYNTAVGQSALAGNKAGGSNVAVGFQSLLTATAGSGNVALGYKAGYYETGSNKLFIDNAARADEADGRIKALIYGIFDAAVANQSLTFNAGNMGFFGHVAAPQPTKAGHNNWAALSDVVAALVAIGVFDAA